MVTQSGFGPIYPLCSEAPKKPQTGHFIHDDRKLSSNFVPSVHGSAVLLARDFLLILILTVCVCCSLGLACGM